MLTLIPKNIIQWRRSWLNGKHSRRTSTIKNATTNGIFSTFFLSVDVMLGREARDILAQLSQIMAAKMDEPILHMRGSMNSQTSIEVAR